MNKTFCCNACGHKDAYSVPVPTYCPLCGSDVETDLTYAKAVDEAREAARATNKRMIVFMFLDMKTYAYIPEWAYNQIKDKNLSYCITIWG